MVPSLLFSLGYRDDMANRIPPGPRHFSFSVCSIRQTLKT
jgi:hypothetical protein